MLFHCNNKGRHYSDPGYKPVCVKQCEDCAEDYPPGDQDPNATYNAEVKRIAEILGKTQYDRATNGAKILGMDNLEFMLDDLILIKEKEAKLMVAEIARAVRQALYSNAISNRKEYLIKCGFLPVIGQEDDEL